MRCLVRWKLNDRHEAYSGPRGGGSSFAQQEDSSGSQGLQVSLGQSIKLTGMRMRCVGPIGASASLIYRIATNQRGHIEPRSFPTARFYRATNYPTGARRTTLLRSMADN